MKPPSDTLLYFLIKNVTPSAITIIPKTEKYIGLVLYAVVGGVPMFWIIWSQVHLKIKFIQINSVQV